MRGSLKRCDSLLFLKFCINVYFVKRRFSNHILLKKMLTLNVPSHIFIVFSQHSSLFSFFFFWQTFSFPSNIFMVVNIFTVAMQTSVPSLTFFLFLYNIFTALWSFHWFSSSFSLFPKMFTVFSSIYTFHNISTIFHQHVHSSITFQVFL